MAAAYAALLSLSNVLHQILNPPPTHHFIIPIEQIELLQEQVSSLINFLERCSSREIAGLEKRIVGAVCKAEDTIESNVVRQILAKSAAHRSMELKIRELLPFLKVLKKKAVLKIIKNLVAIQRKLEEIEGRNGVEIVRLNTTAARSSRSLSVGKNIMIGFDEHLKKIRSDLTSDETNLLILPIVGMGGIGKTTLAANVYSDPYITERFDICAWVSVSLEYKERDIVLALLQQINSKIQGNGLSADELGVLLYRQLLSGRYLIVLDDMWDIQAWENLKGYLPNKSDGSRILVTTRLGQLATEFRSCSPYVISLLDGETSWELIREYVFGSEDCPIELEGIGRSIARGCGGLPLALVVISGLLAKSERKRGFWEYVNKNVTSAANHETDEHCIRILRLSYSELPVHLKPCFLYFAVFPKDFEVRRSRLVRLWISEGFIKPSCDDCLEEVAEGYLQDLFDRNLIMIGKRGQCGKIKNCVIHDFIRELCMIEAQKNEFLCIEKLDASNKAPPLESPRRVSVHVGAGKEKVGGELRAGKHNRSFLSYSAGESRRHVARRFNLLLRVLDVVDSSSMDEIIWLINSRYINCGIPREFHVYSLISLPWNLQTFVFPGPISLPIEFWEMPHLRHLKMSEITLADPPDVEVEDENIVVLMNLQTLSTVKDFIFSDNVLRRIPNLKKLRIDCEKTEGIGSFCLSNLASLLQLESLVLKSRETWENMAFPISLKKLTLSYCQIPWEDMSTVGSLPNLEVLKLRTRATKGQTWSPNAGGFQRLTFLLIDWCQLEIWEADDNHFPRLEHLQLIGVSMEGFPMDFAEIETLRTIDLKYCNKSLFLSAMKMSEDRGKFGYEDIQIKSFPKEVPRLKRNKVVGFEDELETLVGYLNQESKKLDVISIVGDYGIGKTTIASMIYEDPRIKSAFPTLFWVTVSQEFSIKSLFLAVIREFHETAAQLTDSMLADIVRHFLDEKQFLMIVDGVHTTQDWMAIEATLPKANGFGKVVVTTHDEKLACRANPKGNTLRLRSLNEDESWKLLQLKVFGKLGECPPHLEMMGKDIANKCEGSPGAIVAMAGKLWTTNTIDEWENISKSVDTYLKKNREEHMGYIIGMSYDNLPYHLRDCFLYLGMFPEDTEIPAWKLVHLWITEGFIKRNPRKSLEEAAKDHLEDLINRNLVMVDKTKVGGGVKTCRISKMVREFICQRQNEVSAEEKCFQEVHDVSEIVLTSRRLCVHSNVVDFLRRKPCGGKVHSFLCFSKESTDLPREYTESVPQAFSLLRILDASPIKFLKFPRKLAQLIHLRYIAISGDEFNSLPQFVSNLWNLQTIIITTASDTLKIKANIWKMMRLRHLKTKAAIVISKVAKGRAGENLQTLTRLAAQCVTEDFCSRASNLKILGIRGNLNMLSERNCLARLYRLQKLKLVHDVHPRTADKHPLICLPPREAFPPNLMILELSSTFLEWKHMATLALLPTLEVLKLKENAFVGEYWDADRNRFPYLEVLLIASTDLHTWTASSDSFPKLRSLVLKNCECLDEIPHNLVKTLQVLDIDRCAESLVDSAKRMKEQHLPRDGFKLTILNEPESFHPLRSAAAAAAAATRVATPPTPSPVAVLPVI